MQNPKRQHDEPASSDEPCLAVPVLRRQEGCARPRDPRSAATEPLPRSSKRDVIIDRDRHLHAVAGPRHRAGDADDRIRHQKQDRPAANTSVTIAAPASTLSRRHVVGCTKTAPVGRASRAPAATLPAATCTSQRGGVRKTFEGFRSRVCTPRRCSASSAFRIASAISGCLPRMDRTQPASPPATPSSISWPRNSSPFSSPIIQLTHVSGRSTLAASGPCAVLAGAVVGRALANHLSATRHFSQLADDDSTSIDRADEAGACRADRWHRRSRRQQRQPSRRRFGHKARSGLRIAS